MAKVTLPALVGAPATPRAEFGGARCSNLDQIQLKKNLLVKTCCVKGFPCSLKLQNARKLSLLRAVLMFSYVQSCIVEFYYGWNSGIDRNKQSNRQIMYLLQRIYSVEAGADLDW